MDIKLPTQQARPLPTQTQPVPQTTSRTGIAHANAPDCNPDVAGRTGIAHEHGHGDSNGCTAVQGGTAIGSLSLFDEEKLQVESHKNGSFTVSGFPPGNPPELKELLTSAFPNAREIKLVGSSHERPFNINHVLVDGKPYTTNFVSGGFLPGSSVSITPGHDNTRVTPENRDILKDQGPIKPRLSPLPAGPAATPPAPEPLSVRNNNDGSITIGGFPPGNPPDVKTMMREAFPNARDIQVVSENHDRPFSTHHVLVDGQPYTASFLYGGIRPGDSVNIHPGHRPPGL